MEIDEILSSFYGIITDGLSRYCPITRVAVGKFNHLNTRALRNLKHRQKKAHKNYILSNRSEESYAAFSQIRGEFNKLRANLLRDEIYKTECALKSNPKRFFKFVNDRRKTNAYSSAMILRDKQASGLNNIVNLFADAFGDVYTAHNEYEEDSSPHPGAVIPSLSLPKLRITPDDISTALVRLNDSLDRGPDELPPYFLRRCADSLAVPLCLIFNKSLENSIFLSQWKLSYIRPLFKSGNRTDVSNYRGIARLSFIPKLFEALVCDHISFFIKCIIPMSQHGFVKGRSTTTNLLQFTTFIMEGLGSGAQIDSFYADFSKAFDRIDHSCLREKLNRLGFPTHWIQWISSYLEKRKQRVRIGNIFCGEVLSGVPQGSHLGPVLFVLYAHDIENYVNNSSCLLYADDCKLYRIISSRDDCVKLQEDISAIHQWARANGLQLNVKKCHIFSFSRTQNPISFQYSIGNDSLPRPESISDLGVTFDSRATFIPHINKLIAKTMARLGFILRSSRQFRDPYTIKSLYCSLVRSMLEYASIIWSPSYAIHIRRIESVQRRFLLFALRNIFRNVPRQSLPSYMDRLQLLSMDTLFTRRVACDLVFAFKIIQGLIDLPEILGRINFNTRINPRRQDNIIYLQTLRTNYERHQPFYRMCNTFNKFSAELDFDAPVQRVRKTVPNTLY